MLEKTWKDSYGRWNVAISPSRGEAYAAYIITDMKCTENPGLDYWETLGGVREEMFEFPRGESGERRFVERI